MKQCIIHVKDECNIKIEGLDASTKRRLSNRFKYEIPGARFTPAVKLGRWDGKIAFFQMGGSSYLNLLPDILPILIEEKYEIDVEDYRDYPTEFELEKVTEDTYQHIKWPKGHPAEGQSVTLRDYQIEIINEFLCNAQSIQEVATGAGKTIMTAALSERVEQYGRSLVVVPSKSLVVQTEEDYVNMGLDVGVYFGDRKDLTCKHTICTWQSLNNMFSKHAADPEVITLLEDLVCVIVDEAHSAKADVLKTLLTGPLARVPLRWGLTGTIPKEEFAQVGLRVGLGDVINQVTAKNLQDKGVLANCEVNIMQLIDTPVFNNYQSELKYLVGDKERLAYIATMIDSIKNTGNTLVLVDRVDAGLVLQVELSNIFSLIEGSPEVVFVRGATKNKERKEHYDEIKDSTNKIIIATYGVAAVGINIPRIFNLVLLEPGKSFVRVIQSIGRGIRKAKDKDHVQIWDITSTCKFAKRHLTQRKKFYKEASYPFNLQKVDWK